MDSYRFTHYRTSKNLPLELVQIFKLCSLNTHFNIILLFTPRSPKQPLQICYVKFGTAEEYYWLTRSVSNMWETLQLNRLQNHSNPVQSRNSNPRIAQTTYYLYEATKRMAGTFTIQITNSLHGAEPFLRSQNVLSYSRNNLFWHKIWNATHTTADCDHLNTALHSGK
jgi:hypothetical protein